MNKKLTKKQRRYIDEILRGSSQQEAYGIAYPASLKWSKKVRERQAYNTLHSQKVWQVYQQELEAAQEATKKDIIWDRKKSAEALVFVVGTAISEIRRVKDAIEKESTMESDPAKAQQVLQKISMARAHSSAIIDGVRELNKLLGLETAENNDEIVTFINDYDVVNK